MLATTRFPAGFWQTQVEINSRNKTALKPKSTALYIGVVVFGSAHNFAAGAGKFFGRSPFGFLHATSRTKDSREGWVKKQKSSLDFDPREMHGAKSRPKIELNRCFENPRILRFLTEYCDLGFMMKTDCSSRMKKFWCGVPLAGAFSTTFREFSLQQPCSSGHKKRKIAERFKILKMKYDGQQTPWETFQLQIGKIHWNGGQKNLCWPLQKGRTRAEKL